MEIKEKIYLTSSDEIDSTKEIGKKLYPREFFLIIKAKDEKQARKISEKYLNDTYYDYGIPNEFEDITAKLSNMDEDYENGYEYVTNTLLGKENILEIDEDDSILYYFE